MPSLSIPRRRRDGGGPSPSGHDLAGVGLPGAESAPDESDGLPKPVHPVGAMIAGGKEMAALVRPAA